MPIAVITFDFDPLVTLVGDLVVRWQTIGLAAVLASVLAVAALVAGRAGLRSDDLLSIAVGAVPGAVVGGRLGYALTHPDAFSAGPAGLVDPGLPGMDLALGVVGGALTAAYVAHLLGASVGRWAHLLAVPLLLVIGGGKLTMILGGAGQGLPFDGSWATAFLGPGPWGSLAPALPSQPSQAYEGFGALVVAAVLLTAVALGGFRRRDGRLLLVAIAAWTIVRAVVSTTWRDPAGPGPLPPGGWLAVAIAIGAIGLALVVTARIVRAQRRPPATAADGPDWPDPETRPPF